MQPARTVPAPHSRETQAPAGRLGRGAAGRALRQTGRRGGGRSGGERSGRAARVQKAGSSALFPPSPPSPPLSTWPSTSSYSGSRRVAVFVEAPLRQRGRARGSSPSRAVVASALLTDRGGQFRCVWCGRRERREKSQAHAAGHHARRLASRRDTTPAGPASRNVPSGG